VIVGSYFDGVTDQAFVYQGGSFRYLQVPGANDSTAGAINNKGQIVGGHAQTRESRGGRQAEGTGEGAEV
jgi:uncharacterized membrane protein